MNPELDCSRVCDALLDRGPLSAGLAAHLSACPACQAYRQSLEALRDGPSAFPLPPGSLEKQQFFKRLDTVITEGPRPWPITLPLILAGMLVLLLGAVLKMGGGPPSSVLPMDDQVCYLLSREDQPAQSVPIENGFSAVGGRARLFLPDGSMAESTGPADLMVQKRGMNLLRGNLSLWVAPASASFLTNIPGGRFETRGGLFLIDCGIGRNRLTVVTGQARLQLVGQPGRVLSAGSVVDLQGILNPDGAHASASIMPSDRE